MSGMLAVHARCRASETGKSVVTEKDVLIGENDLLYCKFCKSPIKDMSEITPLDRECIDFDKVEHASITQLIAGGYLV